MALIERHLAVRVYLYDDINKKYIYAGTTSAEATLASGVTTEEKNRIRYKNAVSIAKEGSVSYPISCEMEDTDPVAFEILTNTFFGDINKKYKVIFVFDFLKITEGKDKHPALQFEAIIPAENFGGTGQAIATLSYTIKNSGDIKRGIVDASAEGSKWDSATDTYTKDCFTEDAEVKSKIDTTSVKIAGLEMESLQAFSTHSTPTEKSGKGEM